MIPPAGKRRRRRKHARDGVAGPRAPFAQAGGCRCRPRSLGSALAPDLDAVAVAWRWTPSKMRTAESPRARRTWRRDAGAPAPQPPVGRWEGRRPGPRRRQQVGCGRPASDLSVLDRSGSQSQGPRVHAVGSCGLDDGNLLVVGCVPKSSLDQKEPFLLLRTLASNYSNTNACSSLYYYP